MEQQTPGPSTADVLERFAGDLQRRSAMPIVFGGLVRPDQSSMSISCLRGTATNSLANLLVRSGEGLGGKALSMRRPASVRSYPTAQGITRTYDHAVRPEGIEAIMCVPVALPGRAPVAAVYLADRAAHAVGERLTDGLRPVLTELASELHVVIETNRRLAALREDLVRAGAPQAPDLRDEVMALLTSTTDPSTRDGLRVLLGRMGAPVTTGRAGAVSSPLTKRETEVLRLAEQGFTNLEIGLDLGVTDSTVKSYMKAAMAKLGSDNRVRACRTARERGYLG